MAGIYIHIPFCVSRCLYCDFFSTTMLNRRDEYVDCLKQELMLRNHYLPDNNINTIYFGGGTPSLLTAKQIADILNTINITYNVADNAEITLEANPQDLNTNLLKALHDIGVNRLSIGVQTFNDTQLRQLGRRHNALTAQQAVKMAQRYFDNISIDLIYGLPKQDISQLEDDLDKTLELKVQHISTYNLTFEPDTPITRLLQQGKVQQLEDTELNNMVDTISRRLIKEGFERYEVSNYSLPGYHSQHNTSYWKRIPYLGIGAAAHSFNLNSRQWNVADLDKYMSAIKARNLSYQREELSVTEIYNEQVMLGLRYKEGIPLGELSKQQQQYLTKAVAAFVENKKLRYDGQRLVATAEGLKIIDYITRELMMD